MNDFKLETQVMPEKTAAEIKKAGKEHPDKNKRLIKNGNKLLKIFIGYSFDILLFENNFLKLCFN